MAAPRFVHVRGELAFARFDHDATTIDARDETVRLATAEQLATEPVDPSVFDAMLAARGGAAAVTCPPDGCAGATVLLVDRTGAAFALRDGAWAPLSIGQTMSDRRDPLAFGPAVPPPPARLDDPRALCRDPRGRLWLLERGARRILVLAEDDLRWLDTVRFPAGADLVHLACADAGVIAADASRGALFFQPYGGEWREVTALSPPLPAGAVPVAVAGGGDRLAALYRLAAPLEWEPGKPVVRAVVALVSGGAAELHAVPGLEDPLPLLVLPSGHLLVGEVSGPPGAPMRFVELSVTPRWLRTVGSFGVRGFDGRALFLDACGAPAVTTEKGIRSLYEVMEAAPSTEGRVETFALDSERYGCVWHRVFVEACLPPGTSLEIHARTADDLPSSPRAARAPAEGPAVPADPARFPLGSLTADDVEGWAPVGALDRRAAWADVPFAPAAPAGVETLEGLVKQPPGRYLWLRLTLRGKKRRSPAIAGIRATYPRPSILDHLPAFWRNDPAAAQAMDETLALFEGFLTEMDLRIEALPRLLDPRSCPDEALDWLAGFLALALDPRLGEGPRRDLLREGARLFRQRGTVPGLSRLLAIVTGARVDIVEAFRLRRRSMGVLGEGAGAVVGAVLGPGLSLDGDPEGASATAHRFTVVVFRPKDDTLASIVETAIERNKPAHTVHDVCFLEAGLRVGITSFVGFGTRLGDPARFEPFVVDRSPLGAPSTLGVAGASRSLGSFVGGARIGKTTHLL
ncbi:phage tail protein [Sorangium sp. So ce269]